MDGLQKAFNIAQLKPAPIADPNPDPPTEPVAAFVTEIVHPGDDRESMFDAAKRKEILGLIDRGTFQLVVRPEDDGEKLNVLPSRFVLAKKRKDDGEEVLKAGFVIGGHRDIWKKALVHTYNATQQTSIRILMALASILGFDVWSADICQAYLQSATPLLRDVYVRPDPNVIRLGKVELLKLVQPLYGLADAGDYWSQTLTRFHLTELSMEQATDEIALFFRGVADRLVGISATYVDDILQAGTKEFRRDALAALHKNFDMKPAENPPFTFASIRIRTNPHAIDQAAYIDRLQELPQSASFADFRS
jgi:Reverse transcriptase (RNA-dependent DNA polymerase)